MPWMLTAAPFALIHTSAKCGMTLALCTSRVTTRYKTLWMRINEPQIWILQTRISNNVWNCCVNRNLFSLHRCKGEERLYSAGDFTDNDNHFFSAGSAPAPRDVSNPNQYQNGPGSQPLNGAPFSQVRRFTYSMIT